MRSVTQSLNLATTAIGSFLIIPLLLIVNSNPSMKNNNYDYDLNICFIIILFILLLF